jgi:membrane-associated phospholipid phosphatase
VRTERFFARPREAVAAGAVLLGAVALMSILLPAGPLAIDRWWADTKRDLHSAFLKHIALVLDTVGHGLVRWLTVGAIGGVLLAARRWLALAAFAVAEAVAPLLSTLLKALVDRPRPPGGLVHPAGSSFPSGHATYAGTTAVALVLLFSAVGAGRWPWWTAAGLAIAVMAWSRTYLQAHWLSDAVGGALLGIGIAFAVFGAAQYGSRS